MIDHERFRVLAAGDVDGRLTAEELLELEAHLVTCPVCRSEAAQLRRDQLRLAATLSDALVAPRVRSAVAAAAQGHRRTSPMLVLAAAALLLIAIIAVGLFAGSIPPPPPSGDPISGGVASVTGSFTYETDGAAGRSVTIDAHGTEPVKGTWSFRTMPDGPLQSGPVTCLVVDGDDAFMFGPPATGNAAAFLWVHDGAALGGADDGAVIWMQDPGQPQSELEGWCRNAGAGYPGPGPFSLTSGNLAIHPGS